MQKYQDYVIKLTDGNAVPVLGASILVKDHTTGLAVTIYSDNGVTSTTNPTTTDANGLFSFYAADGRYDLTISGTGITTKTVEDVLLEDPDTSDLASTASVSLGDALIGFKQSNSSGALTGATARTVHQKLQEFVSVKDFGATGDGTTDDTTAITAADAITGAKYVPAGTYDTTMAATDLDGPYWGDGQIRDTDDNKRGKYFSAVKAAPSSSGNTGSVSTAFNGDLSKVQLPIEHRITGSATLGQPTSGYSYTPEAYPVYLFLYNSSGYNHSTSDDDGRTNASAFYTHTYHAGLGDCIAYMGRSYVTGTKVGATSFLANATGGLFHGGVTAGADHVYLDAVEVTVTGGAYDCAAAGFVANLDRTVDTASLGDTWMGVRVQSKGAADIDAAYSTYGPIAHGLDLTKATISGSAIAAKADQKIYGNATNSGEFPDSISLGTAYLGYISASSSWDIALVNSPALRLTSSGTPVNYIHCVSQPTGTGAVLKSDGSDTNVQLNIWSKGTSGIVLATNGGTTQAFITHTPTAVNYLSISGAAASGYPSIIASGSDTNISVSLKGKGSGGVRMQDGGSATKFELNTTGIGFFATTPAAKQSITGSRGGNAALADLLTKLATYGLITDSTTA